MKKNPRFVSLLLAGLLTLNAAGCSVSENGGKSSISDADESEDKKDESDDNEEADKEKAELRPQDNYYDYINSEKLKDLEIPYGEDAVSGFGESESQEVLEDFIKEIVKSDEKYPEGSNKKIIRDFFEQCIAYQENSSVENEIMGNCERILAAKDINELFGIWGELYRNYGLSSVFGFSAGRDYRDGSVHCLSVQPMTSFLDVQLKDIKEQTSKCSSANTIARDMLRVMGDDYETADEKGRQMVYLGINIANATNTDDTDQLKIIMETEKSSFEEFDSIVSNLDTSAIKLFLGDEALKAADGIYIYDKEQLRAINDLITDENLEKWKTYLFTLYLYNNGRFIRESNDILGDYNPVSKEAEDDTAISYVQMYLVDELSEEYAERFYTPELDKAMKNMFDEIIGSYDELIKGADWLTSGTRDALVKKLHSINLVTAPKPRKKTKRDENIIGKDLFETLKNISLRSSENAIETLKRKVERDDADMSAMTVNAQYLPCNSINVTVAIMQEPMFDPKASDAANLGRLGSVMAHEIGHAFDSNCINYNADGKLDPDWINEKDKEVLKERADKLADYYSKFTVMEVYHVKGEKTNGENYADLGAMECITNIIDDEDQLRELFENYAQIWCALMVDTNGIWAINYDEHSPNSVRVNAVLASNRKFNEVYDVKEGDGMYFPPEERVSRW